MDISPQFCLRWNNYQSTLHHIFHKLWTSGTFVDVSLVVEGRRIDCHKMILSACSTYFEQLLSEHSSHPHPLILLHDAPYSAVESLVTFMYKGEINVSHDQLTALLKVADALKVKGLADSSAISNFTKYRLLSPDITKVVGNNTPYSYPVSSAASPQYAQPTNGNSAARCYSMPFAKGLSVHNYSQIAANKKSERSQSPTPPKKRVRHDDSTASLPPSPPISLGETQNSEQARTSPQEAHQAPLQDIKIEPEEETDTELQIDESAGQSPEESTESENISNRNTPVPDLDAQEMREREETAQSLAALATQGTFNFTNSLPAKPRLLAPKPMAQKIKEEKPVGLKNGEKSYTYQDLEEGIESVLLGHLTPAKAIAKYKVPRRTFFRRLSAVRKSRGIPSSKENAAAEHFLNSKSSHPPQTAQNKHVVPLVIPGIVANEPFLQNIGNVSKDDPEDVKKDKKPQGLNLSTGNVFSLLNAAANPSYEYYLKYLKLQTHTKSPQIVSEVKKETSVDSNSNLSSETTEKALPLVSQNGSVS